MKSQILPLVTSFGTLLTMWLAGDGKRLAWKVGLATNGLWWWYSISHEQWGLVPLNAALLVVYIRNLKKDKNHGAS